MAYLRKPVMKVVYAEEQEIILNIMPEELWLLVINHTKNPETLLSLYQSSDVFRLLFMSRRCEVLFPLVLDYLAPYLVGNVNSAVLNNSPCEGCGRTRRNESNITQILNTRLVCKLWCFGVEKFCEKNFITESDTDNWSFNFLEAEKLNQMMRHFTKSHQDSSDKNSNISWDNRCPLLGRSVKLCLNPSNFVDHNLKQKVLYTYGEGIVDATFLFYGAFEKTFMMVHIENWLLALPNLRSLKLYGDGNGIFGYLFNEVVENFPLDVKLKLEHLRVHQLPPAVFRKLVIESKASLKSLVIKRSKPGECLSGVLSVINNTKELTSLSINYLTESEYIVLKDVTNDLNLESLEVSYDKFDNFSINAQFRFIESNWKETLTHLSVSFVQFDTQYSKKSKNYIQNLNLPNLKHLCMEMQFVSCLDFLISLKQLESLKLKLDCTFESTSKIYDATYVSKHQLLQLIGFQTNLRHSNVWKELKVLRRINYIWVFNISVKLYNVMHTEIPSWITGSNKLIINNKIVNSGTCLCCRN